MRYVFILFIIFVSLFSGCMNDLTVKPNVVTNNITNNVSIGPFTSGSVIFSNGTDLTQDNSNFYWDDTNNRLGIGTTAPNYSVDSTDIIKSSYFVADRGQNYQPDFLIKRANNGYNVADITHAIGGNRIAFRVYNPDGTNPTNVMLAFQNSLQLRNIFGIQTGNVFVVGLGINQAPDDPQISFFGENHARAGNTEISYGFQGEGSDLPSEVIMKYVADDGSIGYNFVLTSTGELGIGTQYPDEKLHVDGNSTITGSLSLGGNSHDGLSDGDLNASTIYYDTLTAKSPIIKCSNDWCNVEFPKHRKELYINKNQDWTINEIIYNENSYTKQQFWNLVKGTQYEEMALKLNDKLQRLQDKYNCNAQRYNWNGTCYYIQENINNVTYEEAVLITPIYEFIEEEYSCFKLNDELLYVETNCTKKIYTEEIKSYTYEFKKDCGWDNNYYCINRTKITI